MQIDFGVNAGFVEELFSQYLDNPDAVDASWRQFFDERTGRNVARRRNGHSSSGEISDAELARNLDLAFTKLSSRPGPVEDPQLLAQAAIQARIYQLINAYRVRGHLYAHINPLGAAPTLPAELELSKFGLDGIDPAQRFPVVDLAGPDVQTLDEIIAQLSETYCRSIGVEFTHIEDASQRQWLMNEMESCRNRLSLARTEQLRILTKLTEAEILEQFIHRSYGAGTKRFSLEGAESLIPLLDLLIERSGTHGVQEIVLGMAHRGRLNVMANIMGKSFRELFAHFEDADAGRFLGSGDVKYHLGFSTDRITGAGTKMHLTLTFNPSHLAFVNPVVEGRVRAKQDRLSDGGLPRADAQRRVLPLLIHGDAAFIGQGIVAETLNCSQLAGYHTGGTIHVIVNNQIGFTTDVKDARSTLYASDITRMLKVPVFHVNGEDPEAVVLVSNLAVDYRQKFGQDVVIDMYCYRRHGHNEGDEPRYTQPIMYKAVDQKPTVRQVYVEKLLGMGQVSAAQAEEIASAKKAELSEALDDVKQKGFSPATYSMGGVWAPYRGGPDRNVPEVDTSVPRERLIELSARMSELPAGFTAHPKVLPMLQARHDELASGGYIEWGTAEILAYASLLAEGTSVRLSGQDVRRGTFSHRHAVLSDPQTGALHAPAATVAKQPARFDVYNSPLSENGVLGFDFGYSLDFPETLVIWEAQFGDFLNGAQVIVDQFITSSEDKWHRLSGLVLLLPHGFEGQGPEHSSARVERFVQAAAEDNIQVCNLTTPAQLFHVLRRQVLRPWRKPLIILTPKSLLRVPVKQRGPSQPVSTIEDLSSGKFHRVLGDAAVPAERTRKIILCSGKIYFDLLHARDARGLTDIAILRLEQLFPINEELEAVLSPYKSGTPLVWVQEEPQNFGAWYFILANLPRYTSDRFPISCVSRAASASPATGSKAAHLLEQKMLLDEALA